ncbi:MAG TPA: hypothetical protein VNF71_16475 [Acidimicrobiales bacterium]|nr:hypothetical protein [Acidimicrobiales bacterium]
MTTATEFRAGVSHFDERLCSRHRARLELIRALREVRDGRSGKRFDYACADCGGYGGVETYWVADK